jgi:predicted transcriptional regulator
MGEGWINEKKKPLWDPTTKMVHISSVIDKNSIFSTMSPKSKKIVKITSKPKKFREKIDNWNDFYRVNITYDNLYKVLKELRDNPPPEADGEDFGLSPQDWEVSSVYIQYELEEDGGDALLSGSFKGFEVYTSKLPL